MTTRIDAPLRRAEEAKAAPRSSPFVMAGDPDLETSLAILKALPEAGADVIETRHAVHRSDGRRPGDPGRRPARAEGRQTLKKTLDLVREFREGRQRHADRADGLLQPDLHLRRRQVSRRRQGRRRRRPDRRRSAAGGRRRALPAGAEGRAELHPPGDADDRRQAPAGRAREHVGLCLLRLDHRHHRQRQRPNADEVGEAVARIKRHTRLPVASASASARRRRRATIARERRRRRWSARRWSMRLRGSLDAEGRATAKTVTAVADLVAALAAGRRAAPSRPRNKP